VSKLVSLAAVHQAPQLLFKHPWALERAQKLLASAETSRTPLGMTWILQLLIKKMNTFPWNEQLDGLGRNREGKD